MLPTIRFLVPSLLLAAIVSTGCSHISVFSREKVVEADKQNPAAEIVSLWQPAKGPGLNSVPGRGFAGQILFFTRGSSTPVVVEGEVRVYLFDNQGTPEQQAKPIWQFDFPAQDWQNFASMGTLGPSYNVFIPYVREGQQQVECAIQIRFTPKAGPVVYSEMAQVTLPGKIDAAEGGFLPERSAQSPLTPQLQSQALPGMPVMPGQPAPGARTEPRKFNPDPNSLNVQTIRPRPRPTSNIVQASHTAEASEMTAGAAPQAGGVVHADYAEPEPRLMSRDRRIAELEQYVRELKAEKHRAHPPVVSEPYVEPVEDDIPAAPRRLRLRPAAPANSPARAAAPDLESSDWESAE